MLESKSSWNLVPLLASSIKGGGEGRAESSKIRIGRRTTYLVTRSYIKPTNKLVRSHSESLLVLGQATSNMESLDSPWLGLGGSHHLPPYSILYVSPRHLHPNGFLSQDSQGGVPKLSRFRLPPLCELITLCSYLGLG
jgi:hypothetical protein